MADHEVDFVPLLDWVEVIVELDVSKGEQAQFAVFFDQNFVGAAHLDLRYETHVELFQLQLQRDLLLGFLATQELLLFILLFFQHLLLPGHA